VDTKRITKRKRKIVEFIVDETPIKVGSEYIWLWITIEPKSKEILALSISKERNMFVADERYLSGIVKVHGKHPVSTDGGTWYPQACIFLQMDHHVHTSLTKSLMERTMKYIEDRTQML
jgi:putative transposase